MNILHAEMNKLGAKTLDLRFDALPWRPTAEYQAHLSELCDSAGLSLDQLMTEVRPAHRVLMWLLQRLVGGLDIVFTRGRRGAWSKTATTVDNSRPTFRIGQPIDEHSYGILAHQVGRQPAPNDDQEDTVLMVEVELLTGE